jgi:HK97 family phage prohead protease
MTDMEAILQHYTAGPRTAAYTHVDDRRLMLARAPERVLQALAVPVCAGCAQPIAATVRRVVIGASVFHPTCGERHRAAHPTPPTTSALLGVVTGRALPYESWCSIYYPDGQFHSYELYRRGAFDSAVSRRVDLRIEHRPVAVQGRMLLQPSPDGLDFVFFVQDTPLGRTVRARMQRGENRGCSVGYNRPRRQWDAQRGGEIIECADLIEISLCFDKSPSWYGTFVRWV